MTGLRNSFAIADPVGETNELIRAISYEDTVVVRDLVERGADLTCRNEPGCTPLIWAAYKRRPDVVDMLIFEGADLNDKNIRGTTALMFAAKWGDVETARLLIDSGAEIDEKDNEGSTAFDY